MCASTTKSLLKQLVPDEWHILCHLVVCELPSFRLVYLAILLNLCIFFPPLHTQNEDDRLYLWFDVVNKVETSYLIDFNVVVSVLSSLLCATTNLSPLSPFGWLGIYRYRPGIFTFSFIATLWNHPFFCSCCCYSDADHQRWMSASTLALEETHDLLS